MNKEKRIRLILAIFIAIAILNTSLVYSDNLSAASDAPKGYSNYYIRGVCYNVPDSYKLVSEGWDDANRADYANFKRGKYFINITLNKHSLKFNKNLLDTYDYFTINGIKLKKTKISNVVGFYAKKNGVKYFVFASDDDFSYIAVKGPKLSKILSSTDQFDYIPYHSTEYDWESDVYDDSFDDSFDDAAYYRYNW